MAHFWKVVGGADKGGILVRESAGLGSAALSDRLACGAIVKELDRAGDRLRFIKKQGDGPMEGWVTVALRDKVLLEKLADAQVEPLVDVDVAAPVLEQPEDSNATGTADLHKGVLPLAYSVGGIRLEVSLGASEAFVPECVEQQMAMLHTDIVCWIMQKIKLRQDMFLLGAPGPQLRQLVFHFCQMFKREVEYVGITRDTNEADLKQRREIRRGHVEYVDQPPVRAAIEGRVLVLEGVEKAERNVLPLLNNLLENREMALEDGRFLLAPERAEKLQAGGTGLAATTLVPVHPDFIVVAIGQPTDRKQLDPPLRSRFSARHVSTPSMEDGLAQLQSLFRGVSSQVVKRVAGAALQLSHQADPHIATGEGKPRKTAFPASGALSVLRLLNSFPALDTFTAFARAYPTEVVPGAAGLKGSIQSYLSGGAKAAASYKLVSVKHSSSGGASKGIPQLRLGVQVTGSTTKVEATALGGEYPLAGESNSPFAALASNCCALTDSQQECLSAMLMDHAAGLDMCIVSERGMGKSVLVHALARLLGYQHRVVFCYHDLTGRELLQRRTTDPDGNTEWHDSPLVEAATRGDIAVLDGIHRLAPGTLYASLGPLLADRAAILPDSSRLVSATKWAALTREFAVSEDTAELEVGGVRFRRVHPCFRCIAAAEQSSKEASWCDTELLTLFHIHVLNRLPAEELLQMPIASATDAKVLKAMMSFDEAIRRAAQEDAALESLCINVRTFLRLAAHLRERPGDVKGALSRLFSACLRFLPQASQEAVDEMLVSCLRAVGVKVDGLRKEQVTTANEAETVQRRHQLMALEAIAIGARFGGGAREVDEARERGEEERLEQKQQRLERLRMKANRASLATSRPGAAVVNDVLLIGDAACKVRVPSCPELVPDVPFVDIQGHVQALESMLLDWSLGNNLLLVGNQGVGKNKLADRLLCLLRCEREYVQLHRDTTIQGLTLSPSLKDGVVTWVDSPVVRAAREGRCLVVDEADKAPSEVVCILKALCEDNEVSLLDGRTLVREGDARLAADGATSTCFLPVSKNFRMMVLANRPGFPFLGNDFYRVCGDVFSCHTIDNPDIESEVSLLRTVGPSVAKDDLVRLCLLFAELRDLVEVGQLAYPYSTRELVKVVAHLEHFPDVMMEEALGSVFAFDLADGNRRSHLLEVLRRHWIARTHHEQQVLMGRDRMTEALKGDGGQHNAEHIEQLLEKLWPQGQEPGEVKRHAAREQGDMDLNLDPNRDKSKDVTNDQNKDGSNPPEMSEGGPKHGAWDGGQHIGGNMFAGGSGGTGTAGLGGRWGPYRLDVGQELVTVSEESKKGVDEATKRQAEKMAEEAYHKRLQEIRMSLNESKAYEGLKAAVAVQIREMKVALESQEARELERQWMRLQTHGELDDRRLVDGITGSKNIYIRRGEPDEHNKGALQQEPKRITFVMDISGSMYTFNRIDRRLQRLQETAAFIFESFTGFEAKYDYRMVGHSGSGAEAERLVEWGKPPRTEKERLELAKRMEAHAQFCFPGDHTLEGTARAIDEIARKPADERFVFVVSDADLARYNIDVKEWGRILTKHASVKAYVILISNNVDEAERIKSMLAPGRAHICAETTSLAVTFKQIFKDSMLQAA